MFGFARMVGHLGCIKFEDARDLFDILETPLYINKVAFRKLVFWIVLPRVKCFNSNDDPPKGTVSLGVPGNVRRLCKIQNMTG
jgi:hypothetical protein